MSKHTPGPWEVSLRPAGKRPRARVLHPDYEAGGRIVVALLWDEDAGDCLADANLIAATPDLLKACKTAWFALPKTDEYASALAELERAIAKAESQ